MKKFW